MILGEGGVVTVVVALDRRRVRAAGRVRGDLEILGSSSAEQPGVVDHELDPPEPKN